MHCCYIIKHCTIITCYFKFQVRYVVCKYISTMQQREEKQLESALDSIIQRVNDLKSSIAAMIYKVENEYDTLNWPTFLDNYALLSGHVSV